MKVIVLGGAGEYGQVVSKRLAQSDLISCLVVAGRTLETVEQQSSALGPKATCFRVDVLDEESLLKLVAGSDLIINLAGPEHRTILPVLRVAIKAGVNYCDIGVNGRVAELALELNDAAKDAGITAIIGIGAAPGLFGMTAALAIECLDQPETVHFSYCHKFEALIGSPEEHYDRICSGKDILAVPEMYMHGLSGKIRQFHQGGLIEVDAYANPKILPLFGDSAIEVYSFGSSEPITFSRAFPRLKNITANMGFFPPELNNLVRQEIENAGQQGEEKVYRAIVEALIKNPDRLTATTREDVGCGEVVIIEGTRDGEPIRCIAEPCWNSGGFDPYAVTVDPLMVAINRLLQGKVNATGVTSPEACFNPRPFFEELAEMTPIVSAENGSFIRTRFESL